VRARARVRVRVWSNLFANANKICKERKRESNSNLVCLLKNIIYKVIKIFFFTF